MNILRIERGAGNELRVIGEVDMSTAETLQEELDTIVGGDGDIVVDLAEMSFIDSTGIRVLVTATRALQREERRLVLRNPRPNVREILEMLALDQHVVMDEPEDGGA